MTSVTRGGATCLGAADGTYLTGESRVLGRTATLLNAPGDALLGVLKRHLGSVVSNVSLGRDTLAAAETGIQFGMYRQVSSN